jgi:peptidoglycan/xylan/chitin deacetylase (PgdA/CDA1 family)
VLSEEQDHTEGAGGQSLKWSGRTFKYHKIKFDDIFKPSDAGRTFNISLWVYTATATTVKLGTYRISGAGVGDTLNPVAAKTFNLTTNWNQLVWNGYVHTDTTVTQLAIEQPNSEDVTLVNTFYIDDILIEASGTGETGNNTANTAITRESILEEIESNWQSMGYSSKPTKYMALTYDDGPTQQSQALLAALAAKNAKATFFLIGNRISERAGVVRAMRDAGHELANHSFTHQSMGSKSVAASEQEIQDCTDAIYAATNADGKPVTPKFFRAPNLNYSSNVYAACRSKNFALIAGQSTGDYNGGPNANSAQTIADAQIDHAKEWQIGLCHDPYSGISANILAAVPLMIDGLREQGYYLLTLSELLVMRDAGSLTTGKVYQDFVTIP